MVTFGAINAGTTDNIIPERAELRGTIRSVSAKTRDELHELVRRVASHVAQAHLVDAEIEITPGYAVTINDDEFTALVTDVATKLVGAERVTTLPTPIMGTEDWSYVTQRIPAMMTSLGACPPGLVPGEAPANHSNRVVFDEASMATGIALHAAVALEHLNGS